MIRRPVLRTGFFSTVGAVSLAAGLSAQGICVGGGREGLSCDPSGEAAVECPGVCSGGATPGKLCPGGRADCDDRCVGGLGSLPEHDPIACRHDVAGGEDVCLDLCENVSSGPTTCTLETQERDCAAGFCFGGFDWGKPCPPWTCRGICVGGPYSGLPCPPHNCFLGVPLGFCESGDCRRGTCTDRGECSDIASCGAPGECVVAPLAFEKTTNGEDADQPPGPTITVGETVTWRYVVANNAGVDVANIEVTDDQLGLVCSQSALGPGQSLECTQSATAQVGQYANVGTVTATVVTASTGVARSQAITVTDQSHYFGSHAADALGAPWRIALLLVLVGGGAKILSAARGPSTAP